MKPALTIMQKVTCGHFVRSWRPQGSADHTLKTAEYKHLNYCLWGNLSDPSHVQSLRISHQEWAITGFSPCQSSFLLFYSSKQFPPKTTNALVIQSYGESRFTALIDRVQKPSSVLAMPHLRQLTTRACCSPGPSEIVCDNHCCAGGNFNVKLI